MLRISILHQHLKLNIYKNNINITFEPTLFLFLSFFFLLIILVIITQFAHIIFSLLSLNSLYLSIVSVIDYPLSHPHFVLSSGLYYSLPRYMQHLPKCSVLLSISLYQYQSQRTTSQASSKSSMPLPFCFSLYSFLHLKCALQTSLP